MKLFAVFAGFFALRSGNAFSTVPGDNSHYVEGESRYIWMPNGEGIPQLVDLHAPVEENALISRNGPVNQYWLFTRKNPYSRQVIIHGNANTIWASNYISSRPIKVIVHGWLNSGNTEMNPLITAAFLAVQDANVIVLDWSALANSFYTTASAGVPSVGEHLGNFLIWLINTAGGDWNNVHMIGFSLGAHVIGVAGRTANGWPARVTGLDPAGPGWTSNSNSFNNNSGQYVEAIHTDGGMLGIFNPIANVDFYPNGGKHPQPGCWTSPCSHVRAVEIFAASLYYNHLVGKRCGDITEAELSSCTGEVLNMGNANISKHGHGIYGLLTHDSWPY